MVEGIKTISGMAEEDEGARVSQNECIFIFPTDIASIRILNTKVNLKKGDYLAMIRFVEKSHKWSDPLADVVIN